MVLPYPLCSLQWESLCGSVEGELVTLEQLAEEHDQAEIKKVYVYSGTSE